jgi:hypothetical protein
MKLMYYLVYLIFKNIKARLLKIGNYLALIPNRLFYLSNQSLKKVYLFKVSKFSNDIRYL